MFGSLIGKAMRGAAAMAASAVAAELRKPETQQKIGKTIATVQQKLADPETRARAEAAAGTAGKSAARLLGRAAGTLRNKINGDPD
jgi:hypothetical protein